MITYHFLLWVTFSSDLIIFIYVCLDSGWSWKCLSSGYISPLNYMLYQHQLIDRYSNIPISQLVHIIQKYVMRHIHDLFVYGILIKKNKDRAYGKWKYSVLNTLRPRQNRRHFADDILKCIVLNEDVWISLKISLKYAPKGPINNIPALVQIMAWRRPGDEPLSEAMLVSLPTHKCVTRPQWVKWTQKLFERWKGK